MSEKCPARLCPECHVSVSGKQTSPEPDWFWFECGFCGEEWGENTRYCTSDDIVEADLS